VGGVALAALAIVGGHLFEGGKMAQIVQPTAGLIVFGGCLAAVFIQFRGTALRRAFGDTLALFRPLEVDLEGARQDLLRVARVARMQGLVAVDAEAGKLDDPFMKSGLRMAADGADAKAIASILGVRLQAIREEEGRSAKVLEAMGGYAPTIGVLGAVMGLIHVMGHISEPERLGAGIAVAFVATLYGVGAANLLFLPAAGKLKDRAAERVRRVELTLLGVLCIAAGEAQLVIEEKLLAFVEGARIGERARADAEPGAPANAERAA